MYEESLWHAPGDAVSRINKSGSENHNLVLNLDSAPTVMDLLGIETTEPYQGESILPLMNGENLEVHSDGIYYHYYEYPHGWHKVKRHYGEHTHLSVKFPKASRKGSELHRG